jgi:hypothetical protein
LKSECAYAFFSETLIQLFQTFKEKHYSKKCVAFYDGPKISKVRRAVEKTPSFALPQSVGKNEC